MTDVLTGLDAAIELVRKAHPATGRLKDMEAAMNACMDLITDHGATLRAALVDAEKFRHLRDCQLAIDRALAAQKEPK